MNKVILIGNVGANPEIKKLENGLSVASLSIATTEVYTSNKAEMKGQKLTQTEWHKIEAWNALAAICETYIQKGDRICVEGKLKQESWENKDGNKRKTVKIILQRVELLGNKREQVETENKKVKGKKKAQVTFEADDDLPF